MATDITPRKTRILKEMRDAISRNGDLRKKLHEQGTWNDNGTSRPLPNADKRDLTIFIFFETAAAFEAFSQEAFLLAVRKQFGVQAKLAKNVSGHIDRGLQGVMGWAAPPMIVNRSKALFGKTHFLANIKDTLPQDHYDWLSHAHRVRNRIAHPSENAKQQLIKLHNALGVPPAARKGAGPGRILSDYPTTSNDDDRWFHRFLKAYGSYCDLIDSKL
ncbi:hypothetical protein [Sulfuriroseicoccus oceanibius]|uniref:RiboL-PSP-HEPN domain-containing protein n=1 Tax=Sulfuriroseicoccus oceanibius TaxID=2707525 RepID=A0A6B3LBP4_9BACT|nr:hypothetical protein [Sulfuriroseicoccus oceanibius]QQL46075.1 hypothetical protein G3M56_005705 [Sulfuriroseicoccus oceanibius]